MKKKLLLIVAAMLLSMASVFAVVIDGINYGLSGTTATVYAHPDYKYSGDIIIPSTVTYNATNYSVTVIGSQAFTECPALTSITLPNSVTQIGYHAFSYCSALTSITLPNNLEYIGFSAFFLCTALTSITIPNSVIQMWEGVFTRCTALTSIDVESGNANYSSMDGVLFDKEKTILICYPAGKTNSSYTVPSGVTTITGWAFGFCTLTSITLPSSITTIGTSSNGHAFAYCTALAMVTNLRPIPIDISSSDPFYQVETNACTLKVLESSILAYEAAEVWKDFNIVGGILSVSVSANDDKYGTVTGGGYYDINETAFLTATPYEGYKFVNWTKDGAEVSTENPYSFTVTEDVELVANFGQYLVSVSVNNDEYGTATGGGYYDENETATLTATPYEGYKFINWTKEGAEVSTDNPYSFTVTEDVELVANFEDEVGIKNLEVSDINIYPNPTSGELRIENGENNKGINPLVIEIFDIYGRKLNLSSRPLVHSSTVNIDISFLASGIYFVKITTDEGVVVKKVIKE